MSTKEGMNVGLGRTMDPRRPLTGARASELSEANRSPATFIETLGSRPQGE